MIGNEITEIDVNIIDASRINDFKGSEIMKNKIHASKLITSKTTGNDFKPFCKKRISQVGQ